MTPNQERCCEKCGEWVYEDYAAGNETMYYACQKPSCPCHTQNHSTMAPKNCTCASFFTVRGVHKEDCPAHSTMEGDWRESEKAEELRGFIDKHLKPRKPGIGNLDREIIIDFVAKERESVERRVRQEIRGILAYRLNDELGRRGPSDDTRTREDEIQAMLDTIDGIFNKEAARKDTTDV